MFSFKKIKQVVLDFLTFVFIGSFIGIAMSLVSNAFVIGVSYISNQRKLFELFQFNFFSRDYSLSPLIFLLIAAFIVILIKKIFNLTRYQGPADSILVAHRTNSEPDIKTGIGSTFAAFISACGGASVGQYGPLVHFGATVGSFMRRITKKLLTTEIFLGCGVAGAISAGFNAPLTGLVFAHEAIIRNFSQKAIAPIAISSITASAFTQYMFGDRNILQLSEVSPNLIEILPFVLITGPFFGIIAILFMSSLRRSASFASNSSLSPNQLIILASLICGSVGIFLPEILGLGTDTVSNMFLDRYDLYFLLILVVLKILMTAICIGFGLFGGVFSPALFIGASGGAAAAKIFTVFGFTVTGSALTVCGLAAVGAAIIGAPISTVLIVLEMTNSYEFAVIALVSVVTCKLVSNILYGHSFFDRQLLDRGIDISLGRTHLKLGSLNIMKFMQSTGYLSMDKSSKVSEVMREMVKKNVTEVYLTNDQKEFIGKVLIGNLTKTSSSNAIDEIEKKPLLIYSSSSVLDAIKIASDFVGESIPIIDSTNNRLQGVITESDLLKAYLSIQKETQKIETE